MRLVGDRRLVRMRRDLGLQVERLAAPYPARQSRSEADGIVVAPGLGGVGISRDHYDGPAGLFLAG